MDSACRRGAVIYTDGSAFWGGVAPLRRYLFKVEIREVARHDRMVPGLDGFLLVQLSDRLAEIKPVFPVGLAWSKWPSGPFPFSLVCPVGESMALCLLKNSMSIINVICADGEESNKTDLSISKYLLSLLIAQALAS